MKGKKKEGRATKKPFTIKERKVRSKLFWGGKNSSKREGGMETVIR